MFKVSNLTSKKTGKAIANQFKVIMDTVLGRVLLFQSYDTPIAMTVSHRVHGVLYYITTDKKYSRTTSKYQKIFYEKHGKHITQQYSVSNFSEWIEALHSSALFNSLVLQEREKQGQAQNV